MRRAPLLILGTRTLSEEIADLASDAGFEVAGFVENLDRERCSRPLNGTPVRWIDDIGELAATHLAVCGLATTLRSRFVRDLEPHGFRFATVIHPTARVSTTATLGEGTIVSAGAVVAAHTTLGRHVLVNRGVLIGHHTRIGDYVSLQPGANVAGACRVGDQAHVGMGAIVIDHLAVGRRSVVGAGSVAVDDVPEGAQVVGVPARVVKEGIEPR